MKQSWLTTFNILILCVAICIHAVVNCEHRDDIDENTQRIEQLEHLEQRIHLLEEAE